MLAIEKRIDAWVEGLRAAQYERKESTALQPDGSHDFKKGRTRAHAIGDSITTSLYVLWLVRRQLWKEEAFWCELGAISVGVIIGRLWGLGPGQLALLVYLGLSILWEEAVNTANEVKIAGLAPTRMISDSLEFGAASVAGPAWMWGLSWVVFMFFIPGWF